MSKCTVYHCVMSAAPWAYMRPFVLKQTPLQLPRNEALCFYEQNPENIIYRSSGLADMHPSFRAKSKRHYGHYPGVKHCLYKQTQPQIYLVT